MDLVNADRNSQVSALGVGLPYRALSGARTGLTLHASRSTLHASRGGRQLAGRNLDGNQIAWKYRTCAGHEDLLFRDGLKRQAGKCDFLLVVYVQARAFPQNRARIWPQQLVPKRLKSSATRNGTGSLGPSTFPGGGLWGVWGHPHFPGPESGWRFPFHTELALFFVEMIEPGGCNSLKYKQLNTVSRWLCFGAPGEVWQVLSVERY